MIFIFGRTTRSDSRSEQCRPPSLVSRARCLELTSNQVSRIQLPVFGDAGVPEKGPPDLSIDIGTGVLGRLSALDSITYIDKEDVIRRDRSHFEMIIREERDTQLICS